MPELTPLALGLSAAMLALGFVLGWILRGGRIRREKSAINVSWQDQMGAQKTEHDRLADQNKSLMQQVSQYRASKKDADLRAKELSESLKEAFEKRDDLQRQIKDVRNELEVASKQRDKLRKDLESGAVRSQASQGTLKEKDEKIFKLSRELENWQGRLPPLIERFRLRDKEAVELEAELGKARERINSLENLAGGDDTRIEPVDSNPIADGLDASNDQYDETSANSIATLDETAASDDVGEDAEEQTSIETYLEEGTVDFDLGDTDLAAAGSGEGEDDDDIVATDEEDDVASVDEDSGEYASADTEEDSDEYACADAEDDSGEYATADAADDSGEYATADAEDDSDEYATADAEDDSGQYATDDDEDSGEFAVAVAGQDDADEDDEQPAPGPNGRDVAPGRDDLQQIKGVGPAIEKTLNELGIYRFNQIAEMSEYDIDRVARELRGFRSRIYREDWIGQARMLQYEKTSAPA